jgi:16S rRNA (guanine966-N2)-methyltransferase
MLRIIGGTWRGRRLRFPPADEIRPTPDRVRETLFNWLGSRVPGSRCLDLFAGSGALGLEALSRGATQVTFVEREAVAVRELRARLTEWRAVGGVVEHSDALRFLESTAQPGKMGQPGEMGQPAEMGQPFDIAFLDPPFASGLLPPVCRLLENGHWLSADALIYVETDAQAGLPPLPPDWQVTRTKQAGAVGYHLVTRA